MDPKEIWDLAIIGGGIAGTAIARDASLRGIRTILFEKNTLGSGTSSKSSRLIHGGLRYLETAWEALIHFRLAEFWKNFYFVFRALGETHRLHRLAPKLVRPIHLLLPIYKDQPQNRWAVYFGTWLYGVLSRLSGGGHGTTLLWDKKAVLRLVPNLKEEGLLGGSLIWDHTTDDLALVQAVSQSATSSGTVVHEHSELLFYRFDAKTKIYELHIRQGNETKIYRSRKTVNASGPWVDRVRETSGEYDGDWIVPVAGSHLNFRKFTDYSVILQARDKRIFFVINQSDIARVGTTERLHGNPDAVYPEEADVVYLLGELHRYFPRLDFSRSKILSADAGIRPLARPPHAASVHFISREHQIQKSSRGVLHVLGVKLTDHRRAAEETVNLLVDDLRKINPAISKKSLTRQARIS